MTIIKLNDAIDDIKEIKEIMIRLDKGYIDNIMIFMEMVRRGNGLRSWRRAIKRLLIFLEK